MYPITTCPNTETLRKYLLGRIHGAAARQLDVHFESCQSCLENAASIDATDELVNRVSSSAKLPLIEEPFCADAVEVAQRILSHRYNADTRTSDQTLVTLGSGSESRVDASKANVHSDEALRLLRHSFTQSSDGSFDQLGNYRVHEVIGVGGMGFVFRAEDQRLQRPIALKVMRPHLAAQQFERERFLREARAAAAIDHDHVAAVYDVGEVNGIPYIAMPLLQGETLKQRLNRETQLPESEVLRIGMETASGLAAAHTAGLIHRDIKPDNLWLEAPSGRVKILDFGLVRPIESEAELTHDGAVMGTPRYMAPEQATAMPVDHRCDLFSLGATLYRAATGTPAFSGASAMECMSAVMTQSVEPAHRRSENVSREFSAALSTLLQKNPDQRPQSAEKVIILLSASDGIRNNDFRKKLLTGLGAAAVIVLLLGVVITIKYKDGTSTSITVSNSTGSVPRINIDAGNSDIETISISADDESVPEESRSDSVHNAALFDWLFDVGAKVKILTSSSVSKWVVSAHDVMAGDRLIAIDFSGTGIQDKDLERIRKERTLTGLFLHQTALTPRSIRSLSELPKLDFLTIDLPFTIDIARAIAKLPALKTLEIDGSPHVESGAIGELATSKRLNSLLMGGPDLTSKKAEEVGSLRNLIFLGIRNSPDVKEDAFRVISGLPRLNKFAVMEAATVTVEMVEALKNSAFFIFCIAEKTQINADAVPVLAHLPKLTRLEFYITGISPDVVEQLQELKNLNELAIHRCDLSHTQIGDLRRALHGVSVTSDVVAPPRSPDIIAADWLKQVGGEFNIRTSQGKTVDGRRSTSTDFVIVEISLDKKGLQGEDLHNIANLRGLTTLQLAGDLISEAGCERLSKLSSLRFLDLRNAMLDEKSMQHVARLPSLERIELRAVELDADAMAALAKAPKLLGMTLAELSINDSVVAPLSKLTTLQELGITDCPELTSESLRHLREVAGLRDLYLIRVPRIGNIGLSYLNGHPNLYRLGFLDVPIDDEAFQDSLSFPKLFWISFEDTEVSSVGIDRLTRLTMPALQQLQLGSLEVANDCLLPASAWSQLRNLSLTHTTLDSVRLMQLCTLKSLNQLRLIDVTIKEMDKETLRQTLPNCEIRFD